MPNQSIISNGELVQDNWTIVSKDAATLPAGSNLILPINLWLNEKTNLASREDIAVWLDSDEIPSSEFCEDLNRLPMVAINFPVFTDGRGFSIARILRDRFQFRGELRAIGYILRDQLCFMKRCGFNSFVLPDSTNVEEAIESLNDFTEFYQAATDQPLPLFRRV
jgi:uncharacterized protein (DUF934 family)